MAANRFRFSALLIALYCLSCARMAVPPGGPEDKTAPVVVLTYPAQSSTRVALNTDVSLEFSEPVNRSGVEASLYLSPEPGRRLKYRWAGRKLTLDYLDSLPENRTIVVTVGAQAKDLQGNTLESSFTLAFSTGDSIDRGEVAGLVALPEGSKSIGIVAYILGDTLPDPMVDAPDYRMQTVADGTFSLTYLAKGRYRLFALDDRNFDGLWSPASELVGIANIDVDVREGLKPFVTFLPSLQDTTPLALLRVRQLDSLSLETRVNSEAEPQSMSVVDEVGEQQLTEWIPDTSTAGTWRAFLERGLSGDSALLSLECLGQFVRDSFAVSSKPDTAKPFLRNSMPADRSRNRISEAIVTLEFSEPIVLHEQADSLRFELKQDTTLLDLTVTQTAPRYITITPDQTIRTGKRCALTIPGTLITDRAGNMSRDSITEISWYNYPPDSLGSISGKIRASQGAQWLVELYPVGNELPADTVTTFSDFLFTNWPEGDYRIRVIQDVNRNELPDHGRITPFEFSEPFAWHPDTISIRPRWTNEVEFFWTTDTQP